MLVCVEYGSRGAYGDGYILSQYMRGALHSFAANFHSPDSDPITVGVDKEIIVIGGRQSIRQAFGQLPVAKYEFAAAPAGRLICASFTQQEHKGLAAMGSGLRSVQIATGPVFNAGVGVARDLRSGHMLDRYAARMRDTYSRSRIGNDFASMNVLSKKVTILRLFADTQAYGRTGGIVLGARQTGAGIAISLANLFGV